MSDFVTAFAPASIGNVGVGFDMLGLALAGAGDRVIARRTDNDRVTVAEVRGLDGESHPYLSTNAEENTASIAAQALWDAHGGAGSVELKVHKGVPLQSGMGSSAASAVAAAVAANALLESPLDVEALLPYALEGEKFASGAMHTDNVAPSLLGGLILSPEILLPKIIRLPTPEGVSAVLLHPDLQVNTAQARRVLPKSISMKLWLDQQGLLAGFIHACGSGDIELIGKTLRDVVIEPHRKGNVSCFDDVVAAAYKAGALGCTLSGSGPSIFALCRDNDARNAASAMEQACRAQGISCQSWVSSMQAPGAYIVGEA
ncbi:MAG: homoserine kinase [Gammaproteobacteria bacterium]|jgi:homoserine kinase|nr:homoserine kinase [Gammaproteobacteria bacterium]